VKTVILGGTYNPVHIGHLYLAEEVRQQFGYEQVIFIPSNIPAHKDNDPCTDPEHRLEMLNAATEKSDIIVDDCEIRRGGISYTYKTLEDLRGRYSIEGTPGMVIGDDLVKGLPEWKRWDFLHSKIDLIIAHRLYRERVECEYSHRYVDNLVLPISSRDIRTRVMKGKAFRYLVPEAVYTIIMREGLYLGC
jgi:nicotinate-nucleotide adenylyltransferase